LWAPTRISGGVIVTMSGRVCVDVNGLGNKAKSYIGERDSQFLSLPNLNASNEAEFP